MADLAILIDTTRCSGCQSCQIACKGWNDLPAEKDADFLAAEYTRPVKLSAMTWTHVYFYPPVKKEDGSVGWTFFPRMCNHCRDANCIRVCPEHAISDRSGWVIIDQEKCIGCGACAEVCVYKVPRISDVNHKNPAGIAVLRKNRSHKCTACKTLPRQIPACVGACPSGALHYGNRLALLKEADARVEHLRKTYPKVNIYGIDQYKGLRVLTILPDKPEIFSLPQNPPSLDHVGMQSSMSVYTLLSLVVPKFPAARRILYRFTQALEKKNDRLV